MKDRFEQNCKTVGLVFFCLGVYHALTALPLFFQKAPEVTRLMPPRALHALTSSDMADLQAATSYTWKYGLQTLALTGIAPMLMGLYLMRSNNLFVRWCYPTGTRRASVPAPTDDSPDPRDVATGMPEQARGRKRETRYAPPGYFD